MKLNQKNNFWKIRKSDPLIIKISKVLFFIDFFLMAVLLLTLDIWAKRIPEQGYTYEIAMRVANTYFVPRLLGILIHGGMILYPILFIFTFSYLFWPMTKEEKVKYSKAKKENASKE